MMAAVMTDQRSDAAVAHFGQQGGRALQRIGDRLLDQDVNASPCAFDAGLGMKLVGRSDDHRLRPRLVEQAAVIRKDARLRMFGCDLIDIQVRDADQVVVGPLGEFAKVLASDQPGADHADGNVLHVGYPPDGFSRRWFGRIVPRDWRSSSRRVASKAAAIRARV
jgi:hypothetical protein